MIKQRNILISHPDTGEEEWQALREPLMTGWLTQGPKVEAFEKAFAQRHGVKYAFATTSCTTALHLILTALGIGPGDEVIVPAFTWVSTANVVLYCGATPVFVDVDRTTFNIDVTQISKKLSKRTKGYPSSPSFRSLRRYRCYCRSRSRYIHHRRCCMCVGSGYKGRPAGSWASAAAFSFHPRKSITTGEGGMVTTNNEELAQKVNSLRNHGASISEEERHQDLPTLSSA